MVKARARRPASFRLAVYLATRARSERRADPDDPTAQERQARALPPRPDGPLVWVHTGPAGLDRAARELARRILAERPDISFVFTTSGEERMAPEPQIVAQFAPVEAMGAVRRFLDHWRPDLALWTGTDLRPALIYETHRRGVPLMMVETNPTPERTAEPWSRGVSADVLGLFEALFAGSAQSAARLRQMGARQAQIETIGFLREGSSAPSCNEAERDDLARQLGGRPVWLAANLLGEELEAVLAAHRQALRRAHRLLMIVVPADEAQGPDWAARIAEQGVPVALRSDGQEPQPEDQVYVADTSGELGLWYRLAPISFLGTSLAPGGGINPYEAAALGSAIVHGPNVGGFRAAYDRLTQAEAAWLVRTESELGDAIEALLSPARAAQMAHNGWGVSSEGASVMDRVIDLILTEIEAR